MAQTMPAAILPGFYYDEEKAKYFRIQPDHRLPPDAKNSRGNVIKEARAKERVQLRSPKSKKPRKGPRIVRVKRALAAGCTSIDSLAINREIGRAGPSSVGNASEVLNTHSSLTTTVYPSEHGFNGDVTIVGAIPQPSKNTLTIISSKGFHSKEWCNHASVPSLPEKFDWDPDRNGTFVAFAHYIIGDEHMMYAASLHTWGIRIELHDFPITSRGRGPAILGRICDYADPCGLPSLAMSLAPSRTQLAFCYGPSLHLIKPERGGTHGTQRMADSARAATWLDENTIAVDQTKAIRLWDIRTSDSSRRFNNKRNITGLHAINGHELLITDNHTIKVFDNRWASSKASRPVWQLKLRQELAQAKMDINQQGIVALYGEQTVELLSVRSRRHLKTYDLRGTHRGNPIADLRWHDDVDGVPYVQVCVGTTIHRVRMDARG